MLSLVASGKQKGCSLMYADVSRAYFYAKAVRPVYVKLPADDLEPGDEHRCGRLLMSMYDTRDAALNWAMEYGETLRSAGYVQGKGNPCLFHNKALGVSVMVHGDDFVAVARRAAKRARALQRSLQRLLACWASGPSRGRDLLRGLRRAVRNGTWRARGSWFSQQKLKATSRGAEEAEAR